MRFKTFMEAEEEGRWATVKKVKVSAKAPVEPNIEFIEKMNKFIGQHLYFKPATYYPGMWDHTYTNVMGYKMSFIFDPSWLIFDDEEEQPNLFKRDPE